MKMAWLTDLHLDQAEKDKRERFLLELRKAEFDFAVITGDISSPVFLGRDLLALGTACEPRRVFFVLGNHDTQQPQREATMPSVIALCRSQRNLRPVWKQEVIPLTANAALIGHHGSVCSEGQGGAASCHFRTVLPRALSRFRQVWLITHVPPFVQAVRFSGQPVWGKKLDRFVNRSSGGVIAGIARQFPGRKVSVLSGHTHHGRSTRISAAVDITVGSARPGYPQIQKIIEVP